MATKQEILARARQIITENPSAGKERINKQLRAEYGKGLRSSTVLKIKEQVANEQPALYPLLYATGGVPPQLRDIYNGWRKSGFLNFEARELTLGHGDRYRQFDARAVFDSAPGQAARETRLNLVRQQLQSGWTKQQIKDNIIDFYRKSKKVDPWEHIRAEYKPRKRVDFIDYRDKVRRRAKDKQRRLLFKTKPSGSREDWIRQLRDSMNRTSDPRERERLRQQIINLGGKP